MGKQLSDAELEAEIDTAMLRLHLAQAVASRKQAWEQLRALIAQRSSEQIKFMESERGLRP